MKLLDPFYFLQGWTRYHLYYRFPALVPSHIKEQIDYRIRSMNPACYSQGFCVKCGCATTALQMCNKSCDGNCYPPLVSAALWRKALLYGFIYSYDNVWFIYDSKFSLTPPCTNLNPKQ